MTPPRLPGIRQSGTRFLMPPARPNYPYVFSECAALRMAWTESELRRVINPTYSTYAREPLHGGVDSRFHVLVPNSERLPFWLVWADTPDQLRG